MWPVCATELPQALQRCCSRCGEELPATGVAVPGNFTGQGTALHYAADHCAACLIAPPPFAGTVAAFQYRAPVDHLVMALQFHSQLQLDPRFADRLRQPVTAHCPNIDGVMAIPLHPLRLHERGFNQSQEVAAPLARALSKPLFNRLCARIRATAHQTDIDAEARRHNVRDSFACRKTIPGKHLLLVDDVMTTGSTLVEAAVTLLAAGAARVSVAIAARTPQR